jgi:hypothetical protein
MVLLFRFLGRHNISYFIYLKRNTDSDDYDFNFCEKKSMMTIHTTEIKKPTRGLHYLWLRLLLFRSLHGLPLLEIVQ